MKKLRQIKLPLNIVTVFFAIFLLYIIGQLMRSFFHEQIHSFEVTKAPLSNDFALRGFTLHEEKVINAQTSGYPFFIKDEGEKIAVNEKIGVITDNATIPVASEQNSDADTQMKSADLQTVFKSFQDFSRQYQASDFSSVYRLRSTISNQLHSSILGKQVSDEILQKGKAITAAQYGMISYLIDGYEGTTVDDLKPEWFEGSTESLVKKDQPVTSGQPLYKVIESDRWQIVAPLSDPQVNQLKDRAKVRITFVKDYQSANTDLELITKAGKTYAVFTLYHSLFRYLEDRSLDFTVNISSQSGLKIPNSALVYKEFYTLPKSYATISGTGYISVLVRANGQDEVRQLQTFGENETDYYVLKTALSSKDIILKPESTAQFIVGPTVFLDGVYDVSVGYAIFKQVMILEKNEEYSIVDASQPYSIRQYDLIALSADSIGENENVR